MKLKDDEKEKPPGVSRGESIDVDEPLVAVGHEGEMDYEDGDFRPDPPAIRECLEGGV